MTRDERRKMSSTHRPIIGLPSSAYTAKPVILFLSVLLILSPARAQPMTETNGTTTDYMYQKFSPSMAIIIVILVAALFFMGFFSVYIRHCSETSPGGGSVGAGLRRSLRRRNATRGLDQAVIETFPTFMYSVVKGLKIGKGALECAVCLNEFEDDDTLRLIPKCDHVFHPECIDAWLDSHVTCPVCRANLVPQPGETLQLPDFHLQINDTAETQNPQNADEVSIRVVEDPEEDSLPPPPPPQVLDRNQNQSFNQNRPPRSGSVRPRLFGKFPRSHSTGHSLVQPGENTDRFTLRLPEDIREKVMMSRELNRTRSCLVVLPGEGSSRRGYRPGIGEGSSRGRRSYRRLDRTVMSDRWVFSIQPPFFSRTSSSLKSPKVKAADGEGSTSSRAPTPRGTRTAMKLPSFKCLERKGDETCLESETGLVSAQSARHPV